MRKKEKVYNALLKQGMLLFIGVYFVLVYLLLGSDMIEVIFGNYFSTLLYLTPIALLAMTISILLFDKEEFSPVSIWTPVVLNVGMIIFAFLLLGDTSFYHFLIISFSPFMGLCLIAIFYPFKKKLFTSVDTHVQYR